MTKPRPYLFYAAAYAEFTQALNSARRYLASDSGHPCRALFVCPPPPTARCYLTADGLTGYAVTPDGNLCGVFNVSPTLRPALPDILEDHDWRGGFDTLTLDCYEPLAAYYARHGFVETGRDRWDDRYAPPGASEVLGTPDVVYMTRPAPARQDAAA
ncbi:hypothetical protein [Paracoccus sp. (in: a-proteobacteria)]|uniref:hypothetical protein n=1 Tax=Paracoccus sp. TaxID=267 RepID=UPI0026DEDCD7|nr:hypothetical protein [Paracoccus sp. (in: a-proteobacteria)]MDO5647380.1 hypothetical protein [Paracoccus sp. (in: a-proteobacteria)]